MGSKNRILIMKTNSNKTNRVMLQRATLSVHPDTKAILQIWRAFYGIPYGRCLDALVDYAKLKPDFRLPLAGKRKSLAQKEIKINLDSS
jgi:hypothetical protein